jgi:hypothetical protein
MTPQESTKKTDEAKRQYCPMKVGLVVLLRMGIP